MTKDYETGMSKGERYLINKMRSERMNQIDEKQKDEIDYITEYKKLTPNQRYKAILQWDIVFPSMASYRGISFEIWAVEYHKKLNELSATTELPECKSLDDNDLRPKDFLNI